MTSSPSDLSYPSEEATLWFMTNDLEYGTGILCPPVYCAEQYPDMEAIHVRYTRSGGVVTQTSRLCTKASKVSL